MFVCIVQNCDRMASQVADMLQIILMGLSLDKVSVLAEEDHTPSAPPIPQLLISSEEGLLNNGCPGDRHEVAASVCEGRASNGIIKERMLEDLEEKEEEMEEDKEVVGVEKEVEKTEEQKELMGSGQSSI